MCRRIAAHAVHWAAWILLGLTQLGWYDVCPDTGQLPRTSVTSTTTTTPAGEPAAGWCQGYSKKHRPRVPAQTGFEPYCKACYKEAFPRKAAAKLAARRAKQQECRLCGNVRELTEGVCRPCRRGRACHEKGCKNVNVDPDAPQCPACSASRTARGAAEGKLAMWCPQHTTEEQRASGLCVGCFNSREKCYHCGKTCPLPMPREVPALSEVRDSDGV